MDHRYIPLLRPASSFSLPRGVQWDFVEAPADIAHRRPDIPRSSHRYGIISIDRQLTPAEVDHFGLQNA